MASAIDCVHSKCQKPKHDPSLILRKSFMMTIFSRLHGKLPELREYLDWCRGEKANHVHDCNSNESRLCGVELIIDELFHPKEAANRQTHDTCLDLGDELAETLLIEFPDDSTGTHLFMNDLGGELSMSKTSAKEKRWSKRAGQQ